MDVNGLRKLLRRRIKLFHRNDEARKNVPRTSAVPLCTYVRARVRVCCVCAAYVAATGGFARARVWKNAVSGGYYSRNGIDCCCYSAPYNAGLSRTFGTCALVSLFPCNGFEVHF